MSTLTVATSVVSPKTRASRRHRDKTQWKGWAFIGPFGFFFIFVFIAPIIYAMILSLFKPQMNWGREVGQEFVGFDNFAALLQDPNFWSGVSTVTLFLIVQVPIMLFISMFLALAIDSGRLWGASFFRVSVFLPYAVPAVVATLMWGFVYGTRYGLMASLNDTFGVFINFFSPELLLAGIGNIVTWEFVGYNMLIFYSALKTIPHSLYEAAVIDGAGEWNIIKAIKLPALRGAISIALIFSIIGTFQLFNEPNVLKQMANNMITTYYTPNFYAFQLAFNENKPNYSATLALVMGLLTMIVAYVVQLRGMKDDGSK